MNDRFSLSSRSKEVVEIGHFHAVRFYKDADSLCGIVDQAGETVHGVKEAVDTGVDTTNVGLNAVVGTINELMEFFSRFSFISV